VKAGHLDIVAQARTAVVQAEADQQIVEVREMDLKLLDLHRAAIVDALGVPKVVFAVAKFCMSLNGSRIELRS
jgi:hypothetical protein